MPDLWKDIIPSIMQTKVSVFQSEEDWKAYTPFVVNKALSQHVDCAKYANMLNMTPLLPKHMQYAFLLHIIGKRKRPFQKWFKFEKPENLELVKRFFGYSMSKAVEAMRVLSDEDIETIRRLLDEGGTNGTARTRTEGA